jgi:hypothetical protein
MSLPRRERKALRVIEAGICRSDPDLAMLLGGLDELATCQVLLADERGRAAGTRAVARSVVRLAAHGAAAAASAIWVPGVRERLGVRTRPHPMARSPWQRLT